jgi:hypothetical protein
MNPIRIRTSLGRGGVGAQFLEMNAVRKKCPPESVWPRGHLALSPTQLVITNVAEETATWPTPVAISLTGRGHLARAVFRKNNERISVSHGKDGEP